MIYFKHMNKWCDKEIADVIEAIAKCKNPEDVCEMLDIILTTREINDIARRYKIIEMLDQGKSYCEIRESLGVSNATISRVSGKIGFGFRRVHSTVTKKGTSRQQRDPLTRQRGVYYKGMPSPGTMVRNLKK